MSYRYSLLRFVPDPARGEFVNIGAVAGDDDSGDWELRLIQNPRRAKAIDTEGCLAAAFSFAAGLEDNITAADVLLGTADAEPISSGLLERLSTEMRNVVQVTKPTPLVAHTAEGALDLVFSELILDPASHRLRFERKHRALGNTRKAYRDVGLADSLVARSPLVQAGPYAGHFDFAIANGRVVQLVQCWSFQLPNQEQLADEVKAWAWVVQELREHGGTVNLGDRAVVVDPRAAIEVASVFIAPLADQEDTRAFDEARAAFAVTETFSVTADEAGVVAAHAVELLEAA